MLTRRTLEDVAAGRSRSARAAEASARPVTKAAVAGTARKTRAANVAYSQAEVAGVVVTHPERVIYPEAGITKLDVARYYERIHPYLAPFVRQRPLSIVRCPQGPASACFFQKHATAREIPGIASVMITESGGRKPYVIAATQQALVGLAQMGTLELHGWNARADDVELADTIVLDLDPDPAVPFAHVVTAALECRELLASLGLVGFVKTTGGKGLHVVVPLSRRVAWDGVKAFARDAALLLVARSPQKYIAKAAKREREGRIFIDYLRNARGATAVVPYSLRARTGATVATPLAWSELTPALDPKVFTLRTLAARLAGGDDPWQGYFAQRQTITVAIARQLARLRAGG